MQDLDSHVSLMLEELRNAPAEMLPSKYWEELNRKNLSQLKEYGFDNFKRTVANNYFQWLVRPFDEQIRFLRATLPFGTVAGSFLAETFSPGQPPLKWSHSRMYAFLTRMLWAYASDQDPDGELERLEEPLAGNRRGFTRAAGSSPRTWPTRSSSTAPSCIPTSTGSGSGRSWNSARDTAATPSSS